MKSKSTLLERRQLGHKREKEEEDRIEESASVRLAGRAHNGGVWRPLLDQNIGREGYGSYRRLVKKPKRVDSFDVEAMEIAAAHTHQFEDLWTWRTLRLAFQGLGVVYGDMGTSPLYVFSDVFSRVNIESDVDILGALSLVMYTIALIPLAKYVFANNNGEGGTFALYSLICRYAKLNMLPNRQPADEKISSFKLKLPTPELGRALNIKENLERRPYSKTFLLLLVLIGTSMIIRDGILTPTISVMSAVSGLQGEIKGFNTTSVVLVSIVILMALFSIQQFGTSKVGFMFAPALALWFFSLGAIGLYNLLNYDVMVVKAFNPTYIYFFFKKNNKDAWSSLGGCVLCITEAQAMFADLGHFPVPSIQVASSINSLKNHLGFPFTACLFFMSNSYCLIAFTFVVFPCLLLAYMGQVAYLMKYPETSARIFYDSVPDSLFWPVFMVATVAAMIASISATFSCVKQSMALGCFPRLKIIHTSRRQMGQIYIRVINWFLMIMCVIVVSIFRSTTDITNAYGIVEVVVMLVTTALVTLVMLLIWQNNLLMALCFPLLLGSIELIYFSAVLSKVMEGGWLPLVFATFFLTVMYIWHYGSVLKYQSEVREKISMDFMIELGSTLGTVRVPGIGLLYNELFLLSLPTIHSTITFVCIKYVPVPVVPQDERFLFRRVGLKDYHIFRYIARYGYKDVRKEDHHAFEQLLVQSLENLLRKEAQDLALESRLHEMGINSVFVSSRDHRNRDVPGNKDLKIPLIRDRRSEEAGSCILEEAPASLPSSVMAKKNSLFLKKLIINYFYMFLRRNCRVGAANMSVPHMNILQEGMTYMF
ncbi:hypothetical protein E1A91_D01G165500v1 [Gossypium mustelinum]|uniref:Potassium transporter n=1 Tax=Gossypium mustelinum TaxID=34275 RepID=A0A5D2W7R6_GOSMU|nr:hypothetical protein E1A91_D01G165500v1 [Gossypium mustelinum]